MKEVSEFELKGDWFIPDKPENKLKGTLKYERAGRSSLELFGFFNVQEFVSIARIQGICGLHHVVVTDAHVTHMNNETTTLTVTHIFKSKESADPVNLLFDVCIVRFKNFTNFVDSKARDKWLTQEGVSKRVQIDLTRNEPINVSINNDLSLHTYDGYHINRYLDVGKLDYEYYSVVEFRFTTPQTIETIRDYVSHMQHFITLAAFSESAPLSIRLFANEVETEYFTSYRLPGIKPNRSRHEFLFVLDDVREKFSMLITKWFELKSFEKLNIPASILSESINFENTFDENRFLNLAQGLETFHKNLRRNDPVVSKVAMIKEILAVCPEKHKEWLSESLANYKFPSLHDRLDDIMNEISRIKILSDSLGQKDPLISAIKNNRHYYTHYSNEKRKKALSIGDLFVLSLKVRIILVVLFLKEMGVDEETINNLFTRNKHKFFYFSNK